LLFCNYSGLQFQVRERTEQKQVQSSRFKVSGLVVFKNLTFNFELGTWNIETTILKI